MYEIIGTRDGVTKVMDIAKTKQEAVNLWREYQDAFGSDRNLADRFDPKVDWHINLRKKGG